MSSLLLFLALHSSLRRIIENCLASLKTESQLSFIHSRAMDLWIASDTYFCIEVVIIDMNTADNFFFHKKMLLWWNTHSSTHKWNFWERAKSLYQRQKTHRIVNAALTNGAKWKLVLRIQINPLSINKNYLNSSDCLFPFKSYILQQSLPEKVKHKNILIVSGFFSALWCWFFTADFLCTFLYQTNLSPICNYVS